MKDNFDKGSFKSPEEISLVKANEALTRAKKRLEDPIYGVSIKTQGSKILEMINSIKDGSSDISPAELNSYVDQLNDLVAESEGLENKKAA